MSVVSFENSIGRRSEDARRYHNYKISGGTSLFSGKRKHSDTQPLKLNKEDNKIIRQIVTIFRATQPATSPSTFLDLRPYKKALLKAAAVLKKIPAVKQRSLLRKLQALSISHIVTVDVVTQLFRLAKSDRLEFEKARTFRRQTCMRGYKFVKELGSGAFGQVRLFEKGGKNYAVKRIPIVDQGALTTVKQEIEIMKMLKGTGLGPELHDYFLCKSPTNGNAVFLIMDHMNMGAADHFDLLESPEVQKQLKVKLAKLHELGIKHNDLVYNMNNALLHKHPDGRVEVFLGDFGMAQTSDMWMGEETLEVADDSVFAPTGRILGYICAKEGLISL